MGQFTEALNEQIASEFAASQQYVAVAVYFDAQTLPQLAAHFYRQAVEERNQVVRQTRMGNGVVGGRLRVRRRELFESWGCARAENVAALVVLKDDHDRMREPRDAGR
jgi:Ferritin-like domain